MRASAQDVPKPSRMLIVGFLAAAGALFFFAWLSSEVLRGSTLRFDTLVRQAIHGLAGPRFTRVMLGITQLGSLWVLVPLGLLFTATLLTAGRRRAALIFVVAAAGAEVLNEVMKLFFHRRRPDAFFGYHQPRTYSFPSGHSIEAACFYGVMAAILTVRIRSRAARAAVWATAVLLAGAVGFSRIYLGVHYPTDVLAGYAAAVIWVGTVHSAYEYWQRRRAGRE